MKAEKILNRLGLSVNIVIVILLLVIVYYLYCINNNLSVERFNVGSQEAVNLASVNCRDQHSRGAAGFSTMTSGVAACMSAKRAANGNEISAAAEAQIAEQQARSKASAAAAAEATARANAAAAAKRESSTASQSVKVAQGLERSHNNKTAYMAQTTAGQTNAQILQNNKERRQAIGRAQAQQSAGTSCPFGKIMEGGQCRDMTQNEIMAAGRQLTSGGGVQTQGPGLGQSNAAIRAGAGTSCPFGKIMEGGQCRDMTQNEIMAAGRQLTSGGGVQTQGPGLGQSNAAIRAGAGGNAGGNAGGR